jgi:acetylglutamate kinase
MSDTAGTTSTGTPSRADATPPGLVGALTKAATLVEALPWLERFHGSVVVVK